MEIRRLRALAGMHHSTSHGTGLFEAERLALTWKGCGSCNPARIIEVP